MKFVVEVKEFRDCVGRWGNPFKFARFTVLLQPKKRGKHGLTAGKITGCVFLRPRKTKRPVKAVKPRVWVPPNAAEVAAAQVVH